MDEVPDLGDRHTEEFRTEILARIRKGARWLNRARPGWLKLDTSILDLNSSVYCVLGQNGGFDKGKYDLAVSLGRDGYDDWKVAAEYGFYLDDKDVAILYPDHDTHDETIPYTLEEKRTNNAYKVATDLWKEVIDELRAS